MRFFLALIFGCLIGLAVGCGGSGSDKVEIPDNPAPLPKNPPVSSPAPGDVKPEADQKRLAPPMPG
ncbi:MAG: hypothetical protein GX594_05195 [Pirellulaceae bacterium]|nr:hypothetical protein [Pirellulaceae bacterium]